MEKGTEFQIADAVLWNDQEPKNRLVWGTWITDSYSWSCSLSLNTFIRKQKTCLWAVVNTIWRPVTFLWF